MIHNYKWLIGCSGFYYKEWKGGFYPKGLSQNKWFSYYCSQFNTLELNATFYRFPQLKTLESWHSKSPEHFVFSIKAPRIITHYQKFKHSEQLLKEFYEVAKEGLKDKLGCILFQLPPSFEYSEENLNRVIDSLDTQFANVVEFRNIGWWNKKVYTALADKKIIFCGVSMNKLPDEPIVTSETVYYRFHGIPELYISPYDEKELKKVADLIENNKTAQQIFIYFNNTAALAAIQNAGLFTAHIQKFR